MVRWFWFFMAYSFLGFLLEVIFARVTHNPKHDRKCFYFLPLCPVYGLGALAILALPQAVIQRPVLLLICAGVAATAAEYVMALVYEKVTGVSFWCYEHLPFHVHGRVCLLFSVFWGLLGLVLVYAIHPQISRGVDLIPSAFFLPTLMFLALDVGFTVYVLRRDRTTEALRWYLRIPHKAPATRHAEAGAPSGSSFRGQKPPAEHLPGASIRPSEAHPTPHQSFSAADRPLQSSAFAPTSPSGPHPAADASELPETAFEVRYGSADPPATPPL